MEVACGVPFISFRFFRKALKAHQWFLRYLKGIKIHTTGAKDVPWMVPPQQHGKIEFGTFTSESSVTNGRIFQVCQVCWHQNDLRMFYDYNLGKILLPKWALASSDHPYLTTDLRIWLTNLIYTALWVHLASDYWPNSSCNSFKLAIKYSTWNRPASVIYQNSFTKSV